MGGGSGACALARAKLTNAVQSLKASGVEKAIAAERTFAVMGTRTVVKDALTKTVNTLVGLAQKHALEVPLDVAQATARAAFQTAVHGDEFAPDAYRTMASTLDKGGLDAMKQGFQEGLNQTVAIWRNKGIDPGAVARGFTAQQYKNPLVNTIMSIPGQLIGATSRSWYEMSAQLSLYNDAKLYAMREGGDATTQAARVRALLANPTPEMAVRAALRGAEATFQNETAIGEVASRVRSLTRNLGKATKANPEGDAGLRVVDAAYRLTANALIPVTKVPGAVLTKGLVDLTPAGLLRPFFETNGNRGAATIKALATSGVGSMLIAKGYMDAQDGNASGPYDPSRAKSNVTDATGATENSVKINGQWVGIRALLGPYAIPYVLGTALEHLSRAKKDGTAAGETIQAGTQVLSEETFLENFGRVADAAKTGNFGGVATSLVPVPQIVRQVTEAVGPDTKRVREGAAQTLAAAAIPGYSKSLPEAHDVFGRPMHTNEGGVLGKVQTFLDPSRARPDQSDPVTTELQRLNLGVASPGKTLTLQPGNPASPKKELTAQERDDLRAEFGPQLHTFLLDAIHMPEYQTEPDAIKAQWLQHIISGFHETAHETARARAQQPSFSPP